MKRDNGLDRRILVFVAPRAGAWIETNTTGVPNDMDVVAPRAGAWIETTLAHLIKPAAYASPPARGRGLKLRAAC